MVDEIDDSPEDEITDAEVAGVVDELNQEDIRQRSQALHEAQETWEELQFLSTPKIPCRECGASGQVHGGSFGALCPNCMGERMVAAPGAPEFEGMPDFRTIRAQIGAYGDALAWGGQRALPPASSVPTLESINALKAQAIDRCRQLQLAGAAPGVFDPKQLPEARPARGLAGEGDLGEYDDAELDDIEEAAKDAAAEKARRGKR